MFIVFDLDGTLCDTSKKDELLIYPEKPGGEWPEQDWGAWIAASTDDDPIAPIVAVARAMTDAGHDVEFWTGRSEGMRNVTEDWLDKHGFGHCALRMRPHVDPTLPDHVVKGCFVDLYGKPDLIFEDRASVVREWRSRGIICAQVAPNFS